MNWFKENKTLGAFLVMFVILAAGLTYFLFSQRSAWETASQEFETKVATVAELRTRAPFRDSANLKKIKDQKAEYEGLLQRFQGALLERQAKITPIEPSGFQGRLRESVSQVIESAQAQRVALPADFYLGFSRYQKELPRNEAAGVLNWQLATIEGLVKQLVELKVASISEVLRLPVPGEMGPDPAASTPPLLRKYTIGLGFSARQEQFQSFLNKISSSKEFLVIRAVRVENEQRQGPSRLAPAVPEAPVQPSAAPSNATMVAAAGSAPRLIAGAELVKVQIIFDLVDFVPTAAETPAKPKKI